MKIQKTHHRKLSGSVFLLLRIIFDLGVLIFACKDIIADASKISVGSYVFCFMTMVDAFLCISYLLFPSLTCSGNTYIKCLPFLVNSYMSNLLAYHIILPSVLFSERPDRRIPYIAAFNIITLIMYGGLASPLNLAWTETFKPFSIVLLKSKKQAERQ